MFGLKKTSKKAEKNEKLTQKICPFPDCYAITKNPGEHLRSKKHQNIKPSENRRILKLFKEHDSELLQNVEIHGFPTKYTGHRKKEKKKMKKLAQTSAPMTLNLIVWSLKQMVFLLHFNQKTTKLWIGEKISLKML